MNLLSSIKMILYKKWFLNVTCGREIERDLEFKKYSNFTALYVSFFEIIYSTESSLSDVPKSKFCNLFCFLYI